MLKERLKELRKLNGWTQADLSKKVSVSQQTIGSWEVGRAEPNYDTLTQLAELFGVTTDYLLGKNQAPKWATKEEVIELDKILQSNVGMAYGDEGPMTDEDREQINDLIASYYWRKKQKKLKSKNQE
ncbi:helix-turn-helix transcriptional regulator [Enterococcus sp. AZ109]|uniref:helix-turn-helix transcriptional regulator n=1 Tax=Enterococcus sp. AZ109 TaxID=2774634 RepID=UPI003F291D51